MWWLVLFFILGILILHWLTLRPSRFPPGPPCFPIIGSVPFINFERIHLYMEEAFEKYGPLVGLKLGPAYALFVCRSKEVMEIFKLEAFQGRPQGVAITSNTATKGIILTDGPFWMKQRKFTVKHLRDFGFGKTFLERPILEEINNFFAETLQTNYEKVQVSNLFNTPVINVLWAIIAGKRFEQNDNDFEVLLKALHNTFRDGGFTTGPKFLRWYFRQLIGCPEKIECEEILCNFLKESIRDHRKHKTEEPRDFIDVYLNEIDLRNDPDFNDHSLLSICVDLFTAGVESVGNTLSFCILYLILYPEIQEEVREQIDSCLGRKEPSLRDRSRLSKVEAFLSEVARINTISPIPVPRKTVRDVEYCNYLIPKNTLVILSLWSVFHDKEHWGDPAVFRPERFLDSRGTYIKDDWLIQFGLGKRQCPGESVAKNILFLFLVRLLQEFKFILPKGHGVPQTLGLPGFTSAPQSFEVTFLRRF